MPSDPALATSRRTGDPERLPRHVGVIMDGNGRWAAARGKPRSEGHRAGVEALKRLVETAGKRGIEYLTVFSFSSENWRRPAEEINFLFSLLRQFVAADLERLVRNGVKTVVIGRRQGLDRTVLSLIDEVESRTRDGTAMQLNLAFNYGAQNEIADAAKSLAEKAVRGELAPDEITPDAIEAELSMAGAPPPEIIFRTGGEKRLSNFLLWQAAYAEFVFVDALWPEFDAAMFDKMLEEYAGRQRRFGGLS